MATVEVSVGLAWTTIRLKGEVVRGDFLSAIETHFPRLVRPDVIWDATECVLTELSRSDLEAIALAAKAQEKTRKDAKTVFVASTPESYAVVCLYTGIAALTETTVDYSAFSTLNEAEIWILCNRAHQCSTPLHLAVRRQCVHGACRGILHYQAWRETRTKVPEPL